MHRIRAIILFAAATLLAMAAPVRAEGARVYAAGSLSAALPALISAAGLKPDAVAPPVFGPAGLLRRRIEGGETADLFLSADLAQPRAVAGAHPGALVLPFARNRLCVAVRPGLTATPDTLLDMMLDPAVRLATSTPGADPGGDYAEAVFDRADRLHPGAKATLDAKAMRLVGGPTTMVAVAGHSPTAAIFLADRADLLIYYCSGAPATLREVPGLTVVALPPALAVPAVYGAVVLTDDPAAQRLALFILSDAGQAILSAHGLLPVLAPDP